LARNAKNAKTECAVRTSILLVLVLVGVSFFLHSTVNAQTGNVLASYTVYGQLSFVPCEASPCPESNFYLITNGTTPGIPNVASLDFSQSLVSAPTLADVGEIIMVTGYYSQESQCPAGNLCFAFFVHLWGPYYGPITIPNPIPTTPGCYSSSNPPTTWYTVQCGPPLTGHEVPTSTSTGNELTFVEGIALSDLIIIALIALAIGLVFLFFITRKK
jgi:hypothetical protein